MPERPMAEKDPVALLRDIAAMRSGRPSAPMFHEEARAVLARLDAAEAVCGWVRTQADIGNMTVNNSRNLLAALARWKELAEPKPEHELDYDYAASRWTCRCGWYVDGRTHLAVDGGNAFAKHFHDAMSGGAA